MYTGLTVAALVLIAGWAPMALRFQRGWSMRRNPVSLAICAMVLLMMYSNAVYILALTGRASWQFYAIATHMFELVVVINFHMSFRWSDKKFAGARHGDSSPPPQV